MATHANLSAFHVSYKCRRKPTKASRINQRPAQGRRRLGGRAAFKDNDCPELLVLSLLDLFAHVLRQCKIEKGSELVVIFPSNAAPSLCRPFLPRFLRSREGRIG